MCQYKIVCLQDHFYQITSIYPTLPQLLYQTQRSLYDTKQIERLFQPIVGGRNHLLEMISVRDDYSYYHGVHTLKNTLTNETITIKMNEFDIDVSEDDNHHVVFDMIQSFSRNFYMIST